jgi:hypothetical protein
VKLIGQHLDRVAIMGAQPHVSHPMSPLPTWQSPLQKLPTWSFEVVDEVSHSRVPTAHCVEAVGLTAWSPLDPDYAFGGFRGFPPSALPSPVPCFPCPSGEAERTPKAGSGCDPQLHRAQSSRLPLPGTSARVFCTPTSPGDPCVASSREL